MYTYKITGLYSDCIRIKMNGTVIHDGSLIGLITSNNYELIIHLNYGTSSLHNLYFRLCGDTYIAINCNDESVELPMIFTFDEMEKLKSITYLDLSQFALISQINYNDVMTIFNNLFCFNTNIVLKNDIALFWRNIIEVTNITSELENLIYSAKSYQISRYDKHIFADMLEVSAYVDIDNVLYEWKMGFIHKNTFYVFIRDDYYLVIEI